MNRASFIWRASCRVVRDPDGRSEACAPHVIVAMVAGRSAAPSAAEPNAAVQGVWRTLEVVVPGAAGRTHRPDATLAIFHGRHYSRVQVHAEHARPLLADLATASADLLRAVWGPFVAESGIIELSGGDVIAMRATVATNPAAMRDGASSVYTYRREGDRLMLTEVPQLVFVLDSTHELAAFSHPASDVAVAYLWTFHMTPAIFSAMSKGKSDVQKTSEVLQGTLDLMILKTLHAMGPLHGFGIARRLEQVSEHVLQLNEGTVYTSLLRLQQEGWIAAAWGASENNRRAKFYSITKSGLKQLAKETEDWERISGVIGRVLRLASQKS